MQSSKSEIIVRDPLLAAQALETGSLVGLPTETVYGLGARADLTSALARIFSVKNRPTGHPLIVHVADVEAAHTWVSDFPYFAARLANSFWPGPLTLVLPRGVKANDLVTGGQETIALRVSTHPLFQNILDALAINTHDDNIGIAAPSANRFGAVSPTTAQHVWEDIGHLLIPGDVILDAGAVQIGIESTIVDCTSNQPVILRLGPITATQIQEVTGIELGDSSTVTASGMLKSHYAPKAKLELFENEKLFKSQNSREPKKGFIALANINTPENYHRLAMPINNEDYATCLYDALRSADQQNINYIAVILPNHTGIGPAIIDRLEKAATQ